MRSKQFVALLVSLAILLTAGPHFSRGRILAEGTDETFSQAASDKLKWGLIELVTSHGQDDKARVRALANAHRLRLDDDAVFVHIYLNVGRGVDYVDELTQLGVHRINPSHLTNFIGAYVPIDRLIDIARFPFVRAVTPPELTVPDVTTEALSKIAATEYQSAGVTGQGAKIAVIDIQYQGLQTRINDGELPSDIVQRRFLADGTFQDSVTDGDGPHGTACAEIIHDIAPGAKLYLIQVEDVEANLEAVFEYLATEGVRIASMSLSRFPQGPGNGQGRLHTIIDNARQNQDILLINSAGNYGRQYHSSVFSDSDDDKLHEFGREWFFFDDEDLDIYISDPTGQDDFIIPIYLSWDDWGNDPLFPSASADYDLYLYKDGNKVAESTERQDGDDFPLEVIHYEPSEGGTYQIKVQKHGEFSGSHRFRLFVTKGVRYRWHLFGPLMEYATAEGSLSMPADSRSSVVVGAARVGDDGLESYSSRGPTTDQRVKPDITSYARVDTASYGNNTFKGTSAATPHVAGMVALLLEQYPAASLNEIEQLLYDNADDRGDEGKDNDWGWGIGQLPALDYTVKILAPTNAAPDLIGQHDQPIKSYVTVSVNRSNGDFWRGLTEDDFSVTIGGKPANLVSVRELDERYILEVLPPIQAADGHYDLLVEIADHGDLEEDAFQYSSLMTTNVDAGLVIDRSGSMAGTPIENARNSASLFVDLMNLDDMVGVVSFNSDATTDFPLTAVTPEVKESAKTAISAINASGSTSIGDGLYNAFSELTDKGQADHNWAIVLLSDGNENSYRYVSDVLPSIVPTKVKVFAIGLGGVDEALMQEIAFQTNGIYYYTPSDAQLAEIYNSIAGQVAGRQTLYNVSSNVESGQMQEDTLLVDAAVREAIFSLTWNNASSDLDLTLVTPSGTEITSATAANDPQIEFVFGHTYEYYRIVNPEVGEWTTRVHGAVTGSFSMAIQEPFSEVAGESYNLSAQAVTNLSLDVSFDQAEYRVGEAVRVLVSLADSASIAGAQIKTTVQRPDATLDTFTLHDDGLHGDGRRGDGIYAAAYARTNTVGSYQFSLSAAGNSSTGDPFYRIANLSAFVGNAEDGDYDGMPDPWEEGVGLDPTINDASEDGDSDGLLNLDEYYWSTDPFNPDSDGDWLGDLDETATYDTDPAKSDTDYGGVDDGVEIAAGTDPLNPADDRPIRHVLMPLITTRSGPNDPPNDPSNPTPVAGATGKSINADLSWTGGDPNGDSVSYDVLFEAGDSTPDQVLCDDATSAFCDPGTLAYNTHYYWQVIARDEHGATTTGPVWEFTTGTELNYPPNVPSNPTPAAAATGQSINADLSWTGGDPNGDSVSYDVLFEAGDSTPDERLCNDVATTSCDPGTLSNSTHYYWQVIARDEHGATRTGPVWDFITGTEPNNPPYTPSNPIPAHLADGESINIDLSWTGGDPDGDAVTYDVYFEWADITPDVLLCDDVATTTCEPGTLGYDEPYHWQVIARDEHGATTTGPVWEFTTNSPPFGLSSPSPANGSMDQSVNTDLSWADSGDPDGDSLTYDVYFEAGDSTPDFLLCNDVVTTSCDPGTLAYNTHYYWQVIARDEHGATTAGSVWDFTTSVEPTAGPVVYDGHVIDDDNSGNSSGDNDGQVDCGESIEMSVWLYNQGAETAELVYAYIDTSDPYVENIIDPEPSDPNIPSGGRVLFPGMYFEVAADTPDGRVISFDLYMSDDNSNFWSDTFTVPVTCEGTVMVLDTLTADGNWNPKSTFVPGDPIQWVISLENTTGANADTELTYDVKGPNGESVFYWNGTVTVEPGQWWWGLPGTVGRETIGTHTFTGMANYQGTESQASSNYLVRKPTIGMIEAGTGGGVVPVYPYERLVGLGYQVTLLPVDADINVFGQYDIVYLPTNWADGFSGNYSEIEAQAADYRTYVNGGGSLFVDQPNPYQQTNETVTPTLLPYPITFYNAYTTNDWPPVIVNSGHYITQGLPGSDMPGPSDQITELDPAYEILVQGRSTASPSLVVAAYGQGRVLVQTANPNGGFSDEVYHRMIEWVSSEAGSVNSAFYAEDKPVRVQAPGN